MGFLRRPRSRFADRSEAAPRPNLSFEKFQTRSGNEPRAAALERKVANEWMGTGHDSPSVTPYWQKGFTIEKPGVSPGRGNTRTYQMPGKFAHKVIPEQGGTWPSGETYNYGDFYDMTPGAGAKEQDISPSGISDEEIPYFGMERGIHPNQYFTKGNNKQPYDDWLAKGKDIFADIQQHPFQALAESASIGPANKYSGALNKLHGNRMAEWYDKELIDDKPGPAAPLWMLKEWMNRQGEKDDELMAEGGIASFNQHNRPKMFFGGLLGMGALLGLGKMLGGKKRRGEIKDTIRGRPRTGLKKPFMPRDFIDEEDKLLPTPSLGIAEGGVVGLEPGIASLMGRI